jgi:F-type H+-transporting ATPase subunit epsilon
MYKRSGQTHIMAVSGGFAEVVDNNMAVLTDSAELANEINVDRARTALQKAEEALKTLSSTDSAFANAQAAVQRAQTRIEIASGRRG